MSNCEIKPVVTGIFVLVLLIFYPLYFLNLPWRWVTPDFHPGQLNGQCLVRNSSFEAVYQSFNQSQYLLGYQNRINISFWYKNNHRKFNQTDVIIIPKFRSLDQANIIDLRYQTDIQFHNALPCHYDQLLLQYQ